ncbi:hypothetical protein V7x_40580 [Crateriforma conspicua]|uniref:Uncharacterized protein n=1 Tax=Crateriforma conspicua TaxID=2527996 RepID=A0A5C6FLK8_9PLAN|nr:hypothetical protein V7x_40580 [Crateriforma conspicua]
MKVLTSSTVVLLVVQSLLVVFLLLSGIRLFESSVALRDSRDNAERCDRLATNIQRLRRLESVADRGESDLRMENGELVQIARQCAIEERQMTSIQRLDPQTVSETDYQRRDVVLSLQGLRLEQIIRFVLAVERLRPSVRSTGLVLLPYTGPRHRSLVTVDDPTEDNASSVSRELWTAQVTLTQLVYVARSVSI